MISTSFVLCSLIHLFLVLEGASAPFNFLVYVCIQELGRVHGTGRRCKANLCRNSQRVSVSFGHPDVSIPHHPHNMTYSLGMASGLSFFRLLRSLISTPAGRLRFLSLFSSVCLTSCLLSSLVTVRGASHRSTWDEQL
jgi:hypothetical protein